MNSNCTCMFRPQVSRLNTGIKYHARNKEAQITPCHLPAAATDALGCCTFMRRGEKKAERRQEGAGRMRVTLVRPYCYTQWENGPVAGEVAQKLRYTVVILYSITHYCSSDGKATRSWFWTIFVCLTATNFKGNETQKYFSNL